MTHGPGHDGVAGLGGQQLVEEAEGELDHVHQRGTPPHLPAGLVLEQGLDPEIVLSLKPDIVLLPGSDGPR